MLPYQSPSKLPILVFDHQSQSNRSYEFNIGDSGALLAILSPEFQMQIGAVGKENKFNGYDLFEALYFAESIRRRKPDALLDKFLNDVNQFLQESLRKAQNTVEFGPGLFTRNWNSEQILWIVLASWIQFLGMPVIIIDKERNQRLFKGKLCHFRSSENKERVLLDGIRDDGDQGLRIYADSLALDMISAGDIYIQLQDDMVLVEPEKAVLAGQEDVKN